MHWLTSFSLVRRRPLLPWLIGVLTLISVVAWGWQPPAAAVTARHYTDLTFPELREIQIPDYERYELDNGLVVYLMENHELPLVGGSITFRTGERLVDGSKTGLGKLTGDALRLGGTEALSADALNLALEQRAASVETGIDEAVGSASFSALSEDLETVFGLFSDVVRRPAFAPDRIEFLKAQYRGSIARRNDNPDDIASREFYKLIYGDNSPYARTIEYQTLDAISRDDLVAFYRTSVRPDQMILGIVGDFDPAQMKALIADAFGDWEAPAAPPLTQVPDARQARTGVFLVDQPQLTQSYVQIGHLGGQLSEPDYVPLAVLNEVLNGFGGRLFNEVRSRQGLAYVVYAYWAARYDYPGIFMGGGQTRSETTVPFIQSVKREIAAVRDRPITDDELARAKDAVLNSFVFNFQNPSQILSRLIRYEYYGYPSDFVFQFQRGVEATTVSQIQAAAARQLNPDDLVILVVGNKAAIQPPLETLAPNMTVTAIDISIPEADA